MEGTIARYKRRELEREIELLNLLPPFAQHNESKQLYDELKKRRETVRQMLDEATAKIQAIEQKEYKRQELKNQEKSRKARLAKLRADVVRLEKIVEKKPDVGDTAGMAEQWSELQRNYRAKMDEYRLLQDEQRQITNEIAQRKEQVTAAQRGLQVLNSVANQGMSSLRKNDLDAADVVEWLS
ncbi:hypothetical protein FRC10_009160 [Ceratobasidium sp. 414]|nr:hypothetical protein FRC10_009160 [Ceratobasidium sp. 414]